METIILVMMLLVGFNFALKQTFRKPWMVCAVAAVCAAFVALTWEAATEQSKSQIRDWLANRPLMLDVSVVVAVEVFIQMSYCIMAAHLMHTGTVRKRTIFIYRALRWYPGVLILPVLFHIETMGMFTFTGTDFRLIAYCLAAIVLVAIPAMTWAVRWLIPEKELRLEVFFLSNALIAILSIIATTNGSTAAFGISEVNLPALAGITVLTALFALIGFVIYKYVYPSGILCRTPRVHHTVPEGYDDLPKKEKQKENTHKDLHQ